MGSLEVFARRSRATYETLALIDSIIRGHSPDIFCI